MSTIKSSAENLTLNADGANNDIKFQSNGSEVASIDQAGTVTATTFTGAATDATKLPLAGGSMTNMLWVTGTNANNANNVGLGIWGGTTSQGIYARGNAASTNSFGLDSTGTTTFTQAGTARVKISSAGVLSASAGIELGSGLDATAANTLDDYEEGNHAASMTAGASGSITIGRNDLAYTKIGNMVHMTGEINVSSVSSPNGGTRLSLPFVTASHTVDRNMNWGGQGMICYSVAQYEDNPPCLYANAGESHVNLLYFRDDAAFYDFNAAAGDTFMFSFSYKTSA